MYLHAGIYLYIYTQLFRWDTAKYCHLTLREMQLTQPNIITVIWFLFLSKGRCLSDVNIMALRGCDMSCQHLMNWSWQSSTLQNSDIDMECRRLHGFWKHDLPKVLPYLCWFHASEKVPPIQVVLTFISCIPHVWLQGIFLIPWQLVICSSAITEHPCLSG